MTPDQKNLLIASSLSALLGPGAGQIYNKQWKKGAAMMIAALFLLAAFVVFFAMAAQSELRFMAETNPEKVLAGGFEAGLAQNLLKKHSGVVSFFKWSLIALWCYGIVDAYVAAKKRTGTKLS